VVEIGLVVEDPARVGGSGQDVIEQLRDVDPRRRRAAAPADADLDDAGPAKDRGFHPSTPLLCSPSRKRR
jgi:hypothetical protein